MILLLLSFGGRIFGDYMVGEISVRDTRRSGIVVDVLEGSSNVVGTSDRLLMIDA
jgi:hypothetical protein